MIDKTSKQKLKVVAFAKNAKYGYSEIGFISSDTYTGMRQKTDPSYQWRAQTLVTKKSITSSDLASNLMVTDKKQVIDKIPGYKAQNLTLRMITWVLFACFFCYPWGLLLYPDPAEVETVRRLEGHWHVHEPDYLCPTIPAHHHLPHRECCWGLASATMMAPFLPNSVPSFMTLKDNLNISVSFIPDLYFVWCLVPCQNQKVDPIEVIGGNGE